MSPLIPNEPNEKQKNEESAAPDIIKLSAQKNQNAAPPPKKSHHKKADSIISDSTTQKQSNPGQAEDPGAVPVEVEAQATPGEESGGLIGLLKTAKARAEVNEDTSEAAPPKRSHHKGEGTGKPRGRPSGEANREEFSTLVFTILTIVLSFSNLPPEIRPVEGEVKSLAYNIGSILSRHLPKLGELSPDVVDIMGITATLAVWYQRVNPELKRIQAERAGTQTPRKYTIKGNGSKAPEEEAGPTDPIKKLSGGAGSFLDSAHEAGENGSG